jgi:endonuclease YncB( thermonuclease family)
MGVKAPLSPFSTATLSKFCTTSTLNVSVSTDLTALEKGQTFGKRATQVRSETVVGNDVTLEETHGKDNYGYILPAVILPDGANVNHTLVKDSWCWWYRKYAQRNTVLGG